MCNVQYAHGKFTKRSTWHAHTMPIYRNCIDKFSVFWSNSFVFTLWSVNTNCILTLMIGRHQGWNVDECLCGRCMEVGVSIRVYVMMENAFCSAPLIFGFRFWFYVLRSVRCEMWVSWMDVADFLTPTHRFTWQTMHTGVKYNKIILYISIHVLQDINWQFAGYLALCFHEKNMLAASNCFLNWNENSWPWGLAPRTYLPRCEFGFKLFTCRWDF